MKSTKFNRVDYETWKETAIKSLRGIPFEKLITKTVEGIDIQPLYTKEQIEQFSYDNSLVSIRQGQTNASWTVAQMQHARTSESYLHELEDSLHRGNEAIVYDGKNAYDWNKAELAKLAQLMKTIPIYATNLEKDDLFLKVFDQISFEERVNVKGYLAGSSIDLPEGYTNIRTINADMRKVHHDGADSVTELALSLAIAADYATKYDTFSEFENQFYVQFSIDTHFFMEIAKLRAFRALWQTFRNAYGESEIKTIPILSENSLRSYSKLDDYVNLLRAGNEALSAVLGGTDMLTIHPHDTLTGVTPTSIRLARNVQLVIKEETYVNKVIDPAGGSYFIESLTTELIKKAWKLFQEIERKGGYQAYITSGSLEEQLTQNRIYRNEQVATGKKSLIGTNIYADLTNTIVHADNRIDVEHRLAEAYEDLRLYFAKNDQPKIALLVFGELKDFKPRADFVGGFLATGGLEGKWSPAFSTVSEAHDWINQEQFDYGIICAGEKETISIMDEFLNGLSPNMWIDVAGRYDQHLEEKWLANGLRGFIFNGQNKIEKLQSIKEQWKGEMIK